MFDKLQQFYLCCHCNSFISSCSDRSKILEKTSCQKQWSYKVKLKVLRTNVICKVIKCPGITCKTIFFKYWLCQRVKIHSNPYAVAITAVRSLEKKLPSAKRHMQMMADLGRAYMKQNLQFALFPDKTRSIKDGPNLTRTVCC